MEKTSASLPLHLNDYMLDKRMESTVYPFTVNQKACTVLSQAIRSTNQGEERDVIKTSMEKASGSLL